MDSEKIEAAAEESGPLLEVLDIIILAVLIIGGAWWFMQNKKKKEEASQAKSYSIQWVPGGLIKSYFVIIM